MTQSIAIFLTVLEGKLFKCIIVIVFLQCSISRRVQITWDFYSTTASRVIFRRQFKNNETVFLFRTKNYVLSEKIIAFHWNARLHFEKQFISRIQRPWHVIFRARKNAFLWGILENSSLSLSLYYFFLPCVVDRRLYSVQRSRKCTGTGA